MGPSTRVTHRPLRPRRCCQRAWPRSIGGAPSTGSPPPRVKRWRPCS